MQWTNNWVFGFPSRLELEGIHDFPPLFLWCLSIPSVKEREGWKQGCETSYIIFKLKGQGKSTFYSGDTTVLGWWTEHILSGSRTEHLTACLYDQMKVAWKMQVSGSIFSLPYLSLFSDGCIPASNYFIIRWTVCRYSLWWLSYVPPLYLSMSDCRTCLLAIYLPIEVLKFP